MKQRRTLIIALLLVAALALGIGYAAFSAELSINGTATMAETSNQVVFTAAVDTDTTDAINLSGLTGIDTKAISFTVGGFTTANETITVAVTVSNPHDFDVKLGALSTTDLDATNSDGDKIFQLTTDYAADQVINAGGTYTFNVVVKSLVSSSEAVTDTFTLKFNADVVK